MVTSTLVTARVRLGFLRYGATRRVSLVPSCGVGQRLIRQAGRLRDTAFDQAGRSWLQQPVCLGLLHERQDGESSDPRLAAGL